VLSCSLVHCWREGIHDSVTYIPSDLCRSFSVNINNYLFWHSLKYNGLNFQAGTSVLFMSQHTLIVILWVSGSTTNTLLCFNYYFVGRWVKIGSPIYSSGWFQCAGTIDMHNHTGHILMFLNHLTEKQLTKFIIMEHAYNLRTQEVRGRRTESLRSVWTIQKFKLSLNYGVRLCLKENK
jgi:hypothetical protein